MDKFLELRVENQILKSENNKLQVENQNLKSEKICVERQLEEKEKKFQELSLHCAHLQSTILNSNEEDKHPIEPPKKLKKSDVAQKLENPVNEEELVFFQAEEFNFSDPIISS